MVWHNFRNVVVIDWHFLSIFWQHRRIVITIGAIHALHRLRNRCRDWSFRCPLCLIVLQFHTWIALIHALFYLRIWILNFLDCLKQAILWPYAFHSLVMIGPLSSRKLRYTALSTLVVACLLTHRETHSDRVALFHLAYSLNFWDYVLLLFTYIASWILT